MKVFVSFSQRNLLYESISKTQVTSRELTGNILHVWDVIDDATIDNIFQEFGTPKYIFVDSMSQYNSSLDVDVYSVDAWLEAEILNWERNKLVVETSPVVTTHIANFQINKKQINRFLAIKLCEIFSIDVNYTWSAVDKTFDLQHIVQENQNLNDNNINKYWGQLLSPISKFERKWVNVHTDHDFSSSSVEDYGGNLEVWNAGLNDIMSSTAVSIITESVWTQKCATFTEKTAFSVFALTFPIWVGGYNMATEWKKKGFDTFDDIIDHSYESMPTLLERCFYAIYLNLEILTNIELTSALRNKHMDRLIKNRDMLTSENLKNYNRKVISTWPEELQQPALESLHRYLELK